jgi:hypothetical protein
MEALGRHGLTSNRVKELHTDWLQALRGLLAENVAPEKLAAFLAGDCVQLVEQGRQSRPEASTVWMLGTHPLRLRWFISWREELCRYIEGVLSNNLQLSSVNSEYWRQQMASWSAHRYPPVLSIQPGHVHLPVEERGNCERYIPANISHDHGDVVDPRAVKTLVSVGRSYLQTYPYKRDGFHVLFRLGHDGGLVREFVREFVRREPDARLVLHVVTDATSRAVAGLVDTYDNEALLHSTPHSHFPQLEVRHYIDDGDDNTLPASLTSNTVIDLAVVPFLFSGHADISMADDLASASRGHHEKPVLYRPQHTDRDQRSLIINLRPAARDEYLDQWGDAVARVYNRGSVGGESSISYLRLYSDMDQTSHRLQDYLNVAQQVVTIDIGVRRSQLLALVNKPEVTHVYTGVGKNGDYSLVLASNQVVRSLEGRLEELLELHFNPLEKLRQQTIRDIKAHIDLLGPNLVLQACARSAHAAELLGRWALVQWTQQNSPSQGKTWWINLDDHKSWFPGRHADLLRVSVRRDSHSNEVSLSLLVCESKLSTQGSAIASASSELRSTMDLLQDTLPTGQTKSANHELHQRLDQGIWNNALAAAIDDAFSTQNSPLDQDVRDDIMKGMFKVESLEGVGLIWRLENPEPATQESTRENVQIWSLNRETMAQLLGLT